MSLGDLTPGTYRGVVTGIESGHCTARLEVRAIPGGCLSVDYEAVSDEHGLQHIEHTIISEDALYVAFGEARGVTAFSAVAPGIYEAGGELTLRVVAGFEDGELTWAWHWGRPGEEIVERSCARCRSVEV